VSAISLDSGVIGDQEHDDLTVADVLAVGRQKESSQPVCIAVEASSVVDKKDLRKALRRSSLFLKVLRKAFEAEPQELCRILGDPPTGSCAFVIGRRITRGALEEARRSGVIFKRYKNGRDLF
jgi:hypothetical protein